MQTYVSEFLSRMEGGCQNRGYIPCTRLHDGKGRNYIGPDGADPSGVQFPGTGDPNLYKAMGASGVTIATGCDLGQTDAKTLRGYGLDKEIVHLLTPYYGLKKDDAIAFLFQNPILIMKKEAQQIDLAVHKGYLDKYVRPAYEKASGAKFDDLPLQAQAVIMSVCFQKGCGGVRKDWPTLWAALISQDWHKASVELRTGFKQYTLRRQAEGRELASIGGI